MSVMATNTMTSSGLAPGRVSALVSHMDELTCEKLPNYVNLTGKTKSADSSTSSNANFTELGRVNAAFEDYEDELHHPACTNDAINFSQIEDDEHVYANFSEIMRHDEIEDIDRRPIPPTPTSDMQPLRTMPTGWQEYKTIGGRSYYFHPEKKICQWKPPRNPKNFHLLSQCLQQQQDQLIQHQKYLQQQNENENGHRKMEYALAMGSRPCEQSTSLPMDISDEVPLQHDYDTACCSSDGNSYDLVSNGMVSFHSAMTRNFDRDSEQKKLMSQSVSGALLHHEGSMRSYLNSPINLYSAPAIGVHCPNMSAVDSGDINQSLNSSESFNFSEPLKQFSHNQYSAVPVRQGTLEKCRLADCGVKLKKKEWSSAYAYLYSSHLLFYKDQKSAEKTGKHYPTPTDVCDLRGAVISYAEGEKRRKHIILLVLINKTEYLFSCLNDSDIKEWFHAIRQTISALPSFVQTYPLPTIMDYGGSLQRGSVKNKTLQSIKTGSFGSKSSKSKLCKSSSKESMDGDNSSKQIEHNSLTRESIIERLLRFFRQRPSVESLRERGIYKPEPVFGSTLSAICAHEKALVPRFILEVTSLIEQRGLDMDGLYRVNGNLSSVQKIRCQIDQDKYEALETEEDVHVLTGSLKLFFRELSEPLFPLSMNREFMSAIREPSIRQRFKAIDDLLLKLPEVNRETLKVLICHLERVATHSGKNRMQIHNLAIMFGPTLFGTEDRAATARKNSNDSKGGRNGRRKSTDRKDESTQLQNTEPNQNLAYKMMLDEYVVYGRGTADPWHRVSCCQQPTFLFIEFCQVIGPKPLFWCPEQVGPHLDLDQVALWVMSSENLHGSVTCMYDQQLGLYALSIYSTIFDLSARAFQRPFALVLLSNKKPTPSAIQLFHDKCVQFLRPFLSCNRQYFQNVMEHLHNIVDNIDSKNFDTYYTLLSGTMRLSSKQNLIKGLQIAANRTRVWHSSNLNRKSFYVPNHDSKCGCGIELCDFEKFLPFIAEHSSSSYLTPLIKMAPCISANFSKSFTHLYNELTIEERPKGLLFSHSIPILRSFIGANFSYCPDSAENENSEEVSKKLGKSSSFKSFSSGFVDGISHLFAGERIAVLASSQKEHQGIAFMNKLNSLRISKRFEEATWYGNRAERNVIDGKQLVGFVCNSSNSPDWMHPSYPIVIDLNFLRIKCREYSGRFLKPLMGTLLRNFPSDESVMAFLVSLLTDIQQFTVIAKYISPRTLIDRLNMSQADQLIFVNSLVEMNVVKYSFLKKDIEQNQNSHRTQLKQIKL